MTAACPECGTVTTLVRDTVHDVTVRWCQPCINYMHTRDPNSPLYVSSTSRGLDGERRARQVAVFCQTCRTREETVEVYSEENPGFAWYRCLCGTRQGESLIELARQARAGMPIGPNREPAPQPKGAPMTSTIHPGRNTVPAADREHNAAALKRLLADIGHDLTYASDLINSLARRTATLTDQVAAVGDFAVATEQSTASKAGLDEATTLAATMDEHLGGMSTAVVTAEETTTAAVSALAPVDEAEDELRQAGAGTKSVAPARDGA
jgi:hypothetical protein